MGRQLAKNISILILKKSFGSISILNLKANIATGSKKKNNSKSKYLISFRRTYIQPYLVFSEPKPGETVVMCYLCC